ncbi:MAG: hypothetical protein NC926_09580 [Candidatus Omnitrophica bacterium]|nr:hypothetical protein [Candidatus Omnitrophota bacterium]
MASYNEPRLATFKAGGNISKYTFVTMSGTNITDREVITATSNSDKIVGIAMEDATSGQAVKVALVGGGAKLVCGGTVASGSFLVASTGGAGVSVGTDGGYIGAQALEYGTSGQIIDVQVVLFKV